MNKKTALTLSKDLELPLEAVTQTFAILAKRGVGKTYTASVMVEEMLKAQLQVVVVDPIGVWWGLRSSADGKSEGLPVIIAGGEHADVPIEPTSGEVLAEMIVEQHLSMVIDISLFRKHEQHKFMTAFAETLYRKNRQAVHLVLDEADEFAPQRALGGDEPRMLGAIEDLVRRGRARGIGVTMITQRPAVLNKNVLTQIEVLVALRLTSPQDRAAIAEWVKYHADAGEAQEMLQSLGSLPVGTAWFWSPGWLNLFKKVAIRQRETLDSSSTPKVGQQIITPKKMAKVDLEKIREQLSSTIEQVEMNDPKVLKQQIVDLKKQLVDQKPQVKVRQVEVLPAETMRRVNDVLRMVHSAIEHGDQLVEYLKQADASAAKPIAIAPHDLKKGDTIGLSNFGSADGDYKVGRSDSGEISLSRPLGTGEEKILNVISQYDAGVTRQQLTILTGYKQSTRNTYLQRLQQHGFINAAGNRIMATEAGIEILGSNYTPLPRGADLRAWLLGNLPVGEKTILEKLISVYPETLTRQTVTDITGYMQSTRNTYLQRMSAREIIEIDGQQVRASKELFEEES